MTKPTISDVARLAGVSETAAALVASGSPLLGRVTREKVEKVIAEIGYVPDPPNPASRPGPASPSPVHSPRPAAPVSTSISPRDGLIALLYDERADTLLAAAQDGISKAIRGSEFALVIHPLSGDERAAQLRRFVEHHRPLGIILLPPLCEREDMAAMCTQLGCRYVCLDESPSGGEVAASASADRKAVARMVGQFVALGHERIGFVSGPEDSRSARERELGYLDGMADHGLDRGPSLIASGDDSFASGIAAARLLLEVSPRPTAILAGTDEMATGVLHVAGEMGIPVPKGLSIAGFGDTAIAPMLWPPLTTVRVPVAERAAAAVRSLVAPEKAGVLPAQFEPVIVSRGSVGPVPD